MVTSVLNSTIALWRIWYVTVKSQVQVSSRSCRTPHNHHHLHHHHNPFCPPCHRQKKLPPIAPPNNDEWPGEQIPPINFICHLRNARPRNGLPQRPWPSLGNKFEYRIILTGGQIVLYGYLTRLTWHCVTFLSEPCYPCRSSHFVCLTRSSLNLNLLTSAVIALRLTRQGIITPFTNFILNPQQKAFPPAMQSRLPPPPWPSCSPVAKACLLPPPRPSHRLPACITTTVTTQATLTPLGLITGKATGCGLIAISTDPAKTQATITPPGLITGKATGPSEKAREWNQGSEAAQPLIIWRRTMAKQMAHKAAAAAERAEKDRQFKAYQKELGLLLDKDGEE